MMPLAITERNKWRDELKSGKIPDDVRHKINLYKKMRDDPGFRSTALFESLGEAALVLLELYDETK